jgi:hypothetical protein
MFCVIPASSRNPGSPIFSLITDFARIAFAPARFAKANARRAKRAEMTMNNMDLSVIIVNYKSRKKTADCVRSVRSADLVGFRYEIILVDNASGDGSGEALAKEFLDLKCLASDRNLGMGGGNNLGANAATGEFLLILNPDTLLRTDSIRLMLEFLKNRTDVSLVGPKLIYPDGKLQYSCLHFPSLLMPFYRRTFIGRLAKKQLDKFMMLDYDHDSTKEVDWLMGSCMLIRRDLFVKLKGFDERFFMYFEDTDLCRRVWHSGQKVVYLPQAVVIHDHSRGSAQNPWYLAPFTNKLSRAHIASWIKYSLKWKFN